MNPSEHAEALQDPESVMDEYFALLKGCDFVVFTRLFGKITSGVGKEVNLAIERGMAVYELRGSRFVRRKRPVRFVSRAVTVKLYERWRRSRARRTEFF